MASEELSVLVVGGTGRVGRMLRRYWAEAPPRGMTLAWQSRRSDGDLQWDAGEGGAALAARGAFDRLLVLAGVTPSEGADLAANAEIARACADAGARMGAAHMLLTSSVAVYGAAKAHPWCEDDTPAPSGAYGRAKLEAERALREVEGAPPATALRIGNVLGADALMLNAAGADADHPLHLDQFTDGHGPLRSYIGPVTLAQVLETLLQKGADLPDVLNVAAPAPVAMQTLLEAQGTPYVMHPAPPDAVQQVTLDCRRLAGLRTFHEDAADAGAMLHEWRRVGDPA